MSFTDKHFLLIAYFASNIVGLLLLWAAIKRPKLARLLFMLLFGWASWLNYTSCRSHPEVYLSYAGFTTGFYKAFINGWFSRHITAMVSCIAIGQAMISIGMLLKGIWVKLACIGAIIFLAGIAPLGVGSAFPFSATVSLAAYFILRKGDKRFLWNFDNNGLLKHAQ